MSEDDIICFICKNEYSEEENKHVPRILECKHTICQICATKCMEGDSLKCPFCKASTVVPNRNVRTLHKNFEMLDKVDDVKRALLAGKANQNQANQSFFEKMEKSGKVEQESAEYAEDRKLKIACDEDSSHIAEVFCTVCNCNLCLICFSSTHSSKILSKHPRVRLTEKPEPVNYCSYHGHNVAEIVCMEETCTNSTRTMCYKCHFEGKHKNHKYEQFEVELERIKNNIKQTMERLNEVRNFVNQNLAKVKNHSINCSAQAENDMKAKKTEVAKYFERLRNEIDAAEIMANESVEKDYRARISFLSKQEKPWTESKAKIDNYSSKLSFASTLGKIDIVEKCRETKNLILEASELRVHTPVNLWVYQPIIYNVDEKFMTDESGRAVIYAIGPHEEGRSSIVAAFRSSEFNQQKHPRKECVTLWIDSYVQLNKVNSRYFRVILITIDNYDKESHPEGLKILEKALEISPTKERCSIIVAVHKYLKHKVNQKLEMQLDSMRKDSGERFEVRYYDLMLPSTANGVLPFLQK